MTFRELGLSAPILSALEEQGYQVPSPIQVKAIPPALAGRDVLGCAQTGTGKTCAFATPILQRLNATPTSGRPIRTLILTPTRELAIQIGDSFQAYGAHLSLRTAVIFGGVGQAPQVQKLKQGVDILVATPGRLGDLYQQKLLDFSHIEIFVLDEADRMLDMGFIHDVKKILQWLPKKKQTLFFSATMPPEITDLVNSLLHDPVKVAVDPVSSPVEAITQSVYLVDKANKTRLLAQLVDSKSVKNALVFTRTKHGANRVARDLVKSGITAAAIHGNKSQTARQQALADFKAGRVQCLVATDIAARGLDIEELSHVFNYNLPEVPETYVHRIGRTGRAGREGEAIAFCDFSEKPLLKDVEKLIGKQIPLIEDHPFPMQVFEAATRDRNGKLVHAEDAEARAAAKELRRARDDARQTAGKAKAHAQGVKKAQPAPKTDAARGQSPRRKKPSKPEASASVTPRAESKAAAPKSDRQSGRPKMTRSGTLLETGDTMPRTDFHRPNPLDSDVIMDATARLLAPRRSAATPAPRKEATPQKSTARSKQRRSDAPSQVAQPAVKATKANAQRANQPKKATGMPAPEQGRTPANSSRKRDQQRGGRRMPMEMRKPQAKDSTEQPSLMKPYYLDIGR